MTAVYLKHRLQLVDGVYTPSEASTAVNTLIKEKVNYHKLHNLSLWEGDHYVDTSFDDDRVAELLRERENFKSLCQAAKIEGKRLQITGVLNVELVD